MAFYGQIKLFVTTYRRNNNVSENTLQVWRKESNQIKNAYLTLVTSTVYIKSMII